MKSQIFGQFKHQTFWISVFEINMNPQFDVLVWITNISFTGFQYNWIIAGQKTYWTIKPTINKIFVNVFQCGLKTWGCNRSLIFLKFSCEFWLITKSKKYINTNILILPFITWKRERNYTKWELATLQKIKCREHSSVFYQKNCFKRLLSQLTKSLSKE